MCEAIVTRITNRTLNLLLTFMVTILLLVPAKANQATAEQIVAQVEQSLEGENDLDRIEVSVVGSEVILSGRVPHLLAKNRAIEFALQIEGVETVASELELPVEEQDSDLAERVIKSINRYPYYTIWDYIDGNINNGVVTLSGSVTPDRDKKKELYERIAEIRGVQDYIDRIEIQSVSQEDQRLRNVIGRRLSSSEHFQRTINMRIPPYHIIINRGIVTLVGYVQSQVENHEMERIIRQAQGVLRVNNRLQVIG